MVDYFQNMYGILPALTGESHSYLYEFCIFRDFQIDGEIKYILETLTYYSVSHIITYP